MAGCKRPGSCDELSPAVQGSRIPVKDYICMASGLIAVEYGDLQFVGMVTEHAATALVVVICKGGCRGDDPQPGIGPGPVNCSIYRVAGITRLVMMQPTAYAHGN